MRKILIKNAKIPGPGKTSSQVRDILIENGLIKKIASGIKADNCEVFDAEGMIASAGLIDMHVHLREPGYEYKEDIESGCRSAACGGFTAVCCMPNTRPPADNRGIIEFIIERKNKLNLIEVYPIAAITKGLQGEELAEIADLKEAGAVAISDDGRPVMNAGVMRRALEYASMYDLPVITHNEDTDLSGNGVMNEGYVSTLLGLKGICRAAETAMIARDIELARFTRARLHIAHVSCKESVELVRSAKKQGVRITCECTPHHFTLTEDSVKEYDTNTKVNPPLRTAEDVAAIKQGLKDGTIDCIATDHAPHAEAEKDVEYDHAPFGIIGLETAVGLVMTELVHKKVLSLNQALEKMTVNPAGILNLKKGRLEEGACADLTLIDPQEKWTVTKEDIVSKSKNSPFIGMPLKGRVKLTIAGGRIVYNPRNGKK